METRTFLASEPRPEPAKSMCSTKPGAVPKGITLCSYFTKPADPQYLHLTRNTQHYSAFKGEMHNRACKQQQQQKRSGSDAFTTASLYPSSTLLYIQSSSASPGASSPAGARKLDDAESLQRGLWRWS